jgi:hypothetical protein
MILGILDLVVRVVDIKVLAHHRCGFDFVPPTETIFSLISTFNKQLV